MINYTSLIAYKGISYPSNQFHGCVNFQDKHNMQPIKCTTESLADNIDRSYHLTTIWKWLKDMLGKYIYACK